MKSKLIIFFAFASFVQSYSHLPLTYGLSENQLAILAEITIHQEASIESFAAGFNPVFDRLNRLIVKSIFNLRAKTDDDSSKLIIGLGRALNAVDFSFESLRLVVGKSCSDILPARRATHHNLEDVYARISNALALARFGNDHRNRAAIEIHRIAVQADFDNLVKTFYDTICVCLVTCKDADALAVIKNAHDGSRLGLFHLTNAVFNAIKEYAAAVATRYADISLVSDIEDFRSKAFIGIKNDAEYKFSALKTFYIASNINEKRILSGLAAIQYAQTVGSKRYNEAMEVVFGTISTYLRRVALKFQDDGKDDFTRTDAALRTVIAKFDAGDVAIFSSLLVLYPGSSVAILKAQTEMFALEDVGVGAFYDAIYAAVAPGNNYTVARQEIERISNATVSLASDYTGFFFRFIRNNQSFGEKIEADLKTLNDEAIRVDYIAMEKLFDAVLILARANHEGVVREGDFFAIQTLLIESNSGLDEFTKAVAAACLIVLRASNVN